MATTGLKNVWIYFLLLAIGTLVPSIEVPNAGDCADGSYTHDGKTCCLCAPGQKVLKHCTDSPTNGECGFCEEGKTYREEPNSQTTCELCDSCSHPNANLEVVERCTTSRNAKCGCQKGYYCDSEKGSCVVCQSCDICESTGIKIACNGTSNTVCNESQGISAGAIAGIVIVIILAILVTGGVIWWKKTRQLSDGAEPDSEELEYLNEVDIKPHLADIAQILGWKDMLYIARKSKMLDTTIDSCQLNHPNDTEESTVELLQKWSEIKGRTGVRSLVQMLNASRKQDKKERILNLIKNDTNNECSNPV
uniref:Tumor necrosis factor receptor superfamily member 6 n=1 Tax=Oryzias latipes TaxID=8090 RepID=Q56VC6_ORYLA|nr:Fas [Oryzias latipes]